MNSAATTASAAPSVAVTKPPKIPPRMITGSISAHDASLSAWISLMSEKRCSTGKSFFQA